MKSDFESDGFEIVAGLVWTEECDRLSAELTGIHESQSEATPGRLGGLRNVLRVSALASAVARSCVLTDLLRGRMGAEPFPVRAIFFGKTPGANWSVAWHQDLSIAVTRQKETPGFGNWSVKEGVVHVQPPAAILEHMVTVRIHLDDCPEWNGALKVICGSHLQGRLSQAEIAAAVASVPATVCEARKGDTLLMRPLLLHSSSPAALPGHRRVLHIEYAAESLPNGLDWYDVASPLCAIAPGDAIHASEAATRFRSPARDGRK